MESFIEKHADKIVGCISYFDRVVMTGTIPEICFAEGMTKHLSKKGIRIFDYTKFAEPLREEIRADEKDHLQYAGPRISHVRRRTLLPRLHRRHR